MSKHPRAAQIEAELRAIFSHPDGVVGRLRELELQNGATATFPLPKDDWESGLVMIRGIEARIVLLDARQPGTGAFKRLLASIGAAQLMPVVVAPMGPIMPLILRKWGWQCKQVGTGFESWEEWRP